MEDKVRQPLVYDEDQIGEFIDIAREAVDEHMVPNWTTDLINGGFNPENLREMARRWREFEFEPTDFAGRLELLADDLEADH